MNEYNKEIITRTISDTVEEPDWRDICVSCNDCSICPYSIQSGGYFKCGAN